MIREFFYNCAELDMIMRQSESSCTDRAEALALLINEGPTALASEITGV